MEILRKIRDRVSVATSRLTPTVPSNTPSAFFYTFHKCASSLFSSYVLRNINGLQHVDYERNYYAGNMGTDPDQAVEFSPRGHIYGPIRLSAGPRSPAARLLKPTTSEDFISDKTALFLIRDPRDILVSRYYSFGFSHGESSVSEIRERQRAQRERILALGVDQYAIEFAPRVKRDFEHLIRLSDACDKAVVLKFEDMVNDFPTFRTGLTSHLDVSDSVIDEIYNRSRPKEKENISSHRRSGKSGGYVTKLAEGTVEQINDELGSILDRFTYERPST